MPNDGIDINYIAKLARLELSDEEKNEYGAKLGQILQHVVQLSKADVSNVEPTAHAIARSNVVRPDEIKPSLSNEEALQNAPSSANGLFLVPKIVE